MSIENEDYVNFLLKNLQDNVSSEDLKSFTLDDILNNLFNLLPIGISIIDKNRSVTKFNPALLKILQIDKAGLLRGDFANRKYISKDEELIEQYNMPTARALKDKIKIIDEEVGIITESGEVIWTSVTAIPLPNDKVIAVIKDITEKKVYEVKLKKAHEELLKHQNNLEHLVKERTFELESANQKMFTILRAIEHSPDSIVITDKYGNINYVNPKFSEITGYSSVEVIGKNPRIMKSGKTNPQIYQRLWRNISTGKEWKGILYNKRKNGELFWESVHISPVQDLSGNIINYIAIKEDITEKKKREEQLIKLNRTLKALSRSSKAMMKATNERDYLKEVCNIILKVCGHSMVWIGILEENTIKSELSLPKDITEYGKINEELRVAISGFSGNVVVNRGFAVDKESNFSSSVLLPLTDINGVTLGFISIYSYQNDAFYTEEVDLLSQLVDDLTYGISTVRLLESSKMAEIELRRHKEELEILISKRTEELQVSNRLLEEAQSIAHFGHWHLNIKTNKLSWSKEVYKIFGITPENFGCTLESFLEYIHPEDREKVTNAYISSVEKRTPYNIEHRIITPKRQVKILKEQCETHYSPEGEPLYSLGVVQDITARKRIEKEIRDHRAHLQELVRKRTEQLHETNLQLHEEIERKKNIELLLKESLQKEKKLNELKTRFISITSHEFRTPLTAILSSMQLIQRYRKKWEDEKLEDQFSRVKNSVGYLTNLLNDTLTLSHAESGKIVFNPQLADLNKIALDIIEEVNHKFSKTHRLQFKFNSEHHEFYLDVKLVRMILLNLLSNALKYTPAGGKIKFDITVENDIKMTISDDGIGIPAEEQEHLFTPFFRAKNSNEIEGTGLGLSIVKQCVELHGGSIEFFSEFGEGSIFIIKLPKQNYE